MTHTERKYVSPVIRQAYLELSTHCNFSCVTCARNSMTDLVREHMSMRNFMNGVRSLRDIPSLERIVLLGYGEALCHPRIEEMLSALHGLGVRLVLVTNGRLLSREIITLLVSLKIEKLYISWDDDFQDESVKIRHWKTGDDFLEIIGSITDEKRRCGSGLPVIGVELVARRGNVFRMRNIIRTIAAAGAERFIVSNLFPYSLSLNEEILYSANGGYPVNLKRVLKPLLRDLECTIANQSAGIPRCCPFIEKGTVFITASGNIAPCPELSHSHRAYYFGSGRLHARFTAGSLRRKTLREIWENADFIRLRRSFNYYEFPDCNNCYMPDECYHRGVEHSDCYANHTPCGECLWARGIVICP